MSYTCYRVRIAPAPDALRVGKLSRFPVSTPHPSGFLIRLLVGLTSWMLSYQTSYVAFHRTCNSLTTSASLAQLYAPASFGLTPSSLGVGEHPGEGLQARSSCFQRFSPTLLRTPISQSTTVEYSVASGKAQIIESSFPDSKESENLTLSSVSSKRFSPADSTYQPPYTGSK